MREFQATSLSQREKDLFLLRLHLDCYSIFRIGCKVANVVLKKRDQNRFTKVYPYARFPKREVTETPDTFKVETGSLSFQNESGPKIYNFIESYVTVPAISAISVETSSNGNVNVYIKSITTAYAMFEVSAPFTGRVTFTVMQVI